LRRIIQVGVGGMGTVWSEIVAASDRWEAAAYVDVNQSNLVIAAEQHGMPMERCFHDVNTAVASVEADALLDVTPQQYRSETCLEAFKHNYDVLCEKPLADTLKSARQLVSQAEKNGCKLMVAQNYRYQAVVQTAKHFIASGRLGTVSYATIDFFKGPHFGGYRESMEYPLLLDMSIHHFDMIRCILGSDIKTVRGFSVNAPWNWNQGDATAILHLLLDNNINVAYNASWVSQGWETSWNGNWRIEGSKGVLIMENDQLFFSCKPDSRREVSLRKWPLAHQAYLLESFYDCLEKDLEPETSGKANLNSLAATHAAVKAVRDGRTVNVLT